jgi:hypothetical protein
MNKLKATFAVTFNAPGVVYSKRYCKSLKSAMKIAASKGWHSRHDEPWTHKPCSATIMFRIVDQQADMPWESLAKVSSEGISVYQFVDMASVVRAQKAIEKSQSIVNFACDLCTDARNLGDQIRSSSTTTLSELSMPPDESSQSKSQ